MENSKPMAKKTYKLIPDLQKKVAWAISLTYILLALIIGVISFWNLTRSSGVSPVIWLIQALPLLLLVPGMLKGWYRSYSWLCFTLLFYFIFATMRVFSSAVQPSDYIFVCLISALFVSSMMAGRWLQYAQKDTFIRETQEEGS